MVKDVFRAAAREVIECYPGITASELGRHLRCGRARAVVLLREETGVVDLPEVVEDCAEESEPEGESESEAVPASPFGRSDFPREATEEDAVILRRDPLPMKAMHQMTIEFCNDDTETA